jgi:hypothetical protein
MSEQQEPRLEGACTCGAVRYRVNKKPLYVHCCHCSWCQRETGSAFVINALIESDQVEILAGEVETTRLPSASGKGQDLIHCSECDITLWSHYAGLGNKMSFLRVGTLDEPGRLPPDIHVYVSSKQPWVILPEGVPAVPEYYDRDRHWPEESLARRRALLD